MFCSHRGAVHSLPLTFKHICSVWYTSHSQFVSPWANTSIPPSPRTFCVLSSFPLLELPLTSCPIYFHSLFNLLWMGFHLCSSVVNRSESYLNFKCQWCPYFTLLKRKNWPCASLSCSFSSEEDPQTFPLFFQSS